MQQGRRTLTACIAIALPCTANADCCTGICSAGMCSMGAVCGNRIIEANEQCDDGNQQPDDGCSATCQQESGWQCTVAGNVSTCTRLCASAPATMCATALAGCPAGQICRISGNGCVCGPPGSCGNGTKEGSEQCDDGNTTSGDGCSAACEDETPPCGVVSYSPMRRFLGQIFPSLIAANPICARCCVTNPIRCIEMASNSNPIYTCETTNQGRYAGPGGCPGTAQARFDLCKQYCGDGDVLDFGLDGIDEDGDGDDEECDDDNNANFDGCSASCKIECRADADCLGEPTFNNPGWSCQSDDCQYCTCQSFKCIGGVRSVPGPNCSGISGGAGGPGPIGGAAGGPIGGATGGPAGGGPGGQTGTNGGTGGGGSSTGNSSGGASSGGNSSPCQASSTTPGPTFGGGGGNPCSSSAGSFSSCISWTTFLQLQQGCRDGYDYCMLCAGGTIQCNPNVQYTTQACNDANQQCYAAINGVPICPSSTTSRSGASTSSSASSCPRGEVMCGPQSFVVCMCGTTIFDFNCTSNQCTRCPECRSSSSSRSNSSGSSGVSSSTIFAFNSSDASDSCTDDSQCSSGLCDNGRCASEAHTVCNQDLSCTMIAGAGLNQCDPKFGCGEDVRAECDGNFCQIMPGPGGLFCSSDDDCANVSSQQSQPRGCSSDLECSIGVCRDGNCLPCRTDTECIAGSCKNGQCGGPTLVAATPVCGNGILDGTEECDDGNRRDGDGCSSLCSIEGVKAAAPRSVCGNGIREEGEGCDAGTQNSNSPGAVCRPNCALPRCGDSIRDINESCDDGNTMDKDGCDRYCRTETKVLAQSEVNQETINKKPETSQQPNSQTAQQLIQFPYAQFPTPYAQFPTPQPYPYASLQPLIQQAPQTTQSGPAAVAAIGAGAAAGWSWMRRRKK